MNTANTMGKGQVLEALQSVFKGVKPFNLDDLEDARIEISNTYKKIKNSETLKKEHIGELHTGLAVFDIIYQRQLRKKVKNGMRILPSLEVANFFDKGMALKKLIEKLGSLVCHDNNQPNPPFYGHPFDIDA